MKRKRFCLSIALLGSALCGQAQINISQCYDWADSNYPLIKQYRLIERSRDYTLSNAAKGWLPQVSASVGGYAFTDVISSGNALGQAVEMKNAVGSASVSVSQTVYDGGAIAAKKQLAEAEADVQRRSLSSSMYEIRQRVNQLYFSVLLLDQRLRMNRLLQDDLRLSEKTVRSMAENGVANRSDLDAISVELLGQEQQESSMRCQRKAYLQMLGAFVGRELSDTDSLEMPKRDVASDGQRPELDYFDSQERALDARRSLLDTQLKPCLDAIAIGMAHTKVADMMTNGMLAAGITLSWNIGTLYTRKNDLARIVFFVVCFMLMSGLFTPIGSMPEWAQRLTLVNPLRYFISAMRNVFIRGGGLASVWREVFVLAALAIAFALFAVGSYRKNG